MEFYFGRTTLLIAFLAGREVTTMKNLFFIISLALCLSVGTMVVLF